MVMHKVNTIKMLSFTPLCIFIFSRSLHFLSKSISVYIYFEKLLFFNYITCFGFYRRVKD